MVKCNNFKQKQQNNLVYSKVEKIGDELLRYCNMPNIEIDFSNANKPGNSSSRVQDVFLNKAMELGFKSEKKGLFEDIPTSNLRPDYYCKIGDSGIIIEVERGKTVMNNMDMLDMWKCHLCNTAHHLFLFVPNELTQNPKQKPTDCFRIVSNRMAPFFEFENYNNVHSLWIFGY